MQAVEKYFKAEKTESLVFLCIGIVCLCIGIYFAKDLTQNFKSGISIPFILIALIQISVGLILFFRTPKDILRVNDFIKNKPQKIQTEELPRMQKVMQSFKIYFYIEVGLLFIGLALHFFCTNNMFINGIGFGLIIQSIFMLIADYFANARGKVYVEFLKTQ
jgi:uncharacterized membrane protein YiaA